MFQLLELIENEEDREFCRKLSEQFDSAMYHVAYGILKNSADAEDAVQESYIAIINNLDKISRENCHKAWNYIVTIVRSRAINVYRRRNRESKMDEDTIENLLQESQGDGEIFELPDGSNIVGGTAKARWTRIRLKICCRSLRGTEKSLNFRMAAACQNLSAE